MPHPSMHVQVRTAVQAVSCLRVDRPWASRWRGDMRAQSILVLHLLMPTLSTDN